MTSIRFMIVLNTVQFNLGFTIKYWVLLIVRGLGNKPFLTHLVIVMGCLFVRRARVRRGVMPAGSFARSVNVTSFSGVAGFWVLSAIALTP